MANPRRSSSYSTNAQNPENPFHSFQIQSQTQTHALSFSSLILFCKKPHAFPFLLSVFLLLTWVSLRLQHSTLLSSYTPRLHWTPDDDSKANLVRFSSNFPFQIANDKRGWLLDPALIAKNAGISGGAVSCTSVHVGEIRPGGMRGNHRHHACNETFVIWGAATKFRLENNQIVNKGYAEVIIRGDEVAVAASPRGTAHALVNIDPIRTTFFLGCQDIRVPHNSSSTDFKVWTDLAIEV